MFCIALSNKKERLLALPLLRTERATFTALRSRMSHAWWIRGRIVFQLVNASPKCLWLFYIHQNLIPLLWYTFDKSAPFRVGTIIPIYRHYTQAFAWCQILYLLCIGSDPYHLQSSMEHIRLTGFSMVDRYWCFRCRLYAENAMFVRCGTVLITTSRFLAFWPKRITSFRLSIVTTPYGFTNRRFTYVHQ